MRQLIVKRTHREKQPNYLYSMTHVEVLLDVDGSSIRLREFGYFVPDNPTAADNVRLEKAVHEVNTFVDEMHHMLLKLDDSVVRTYVEA